MKHHEADVASKRTRGKPYQLPRAQKGHIVGSASSVPEGIDFARGTGPESMRVGDMLLFGHLVAHEFTQHPTLSKSAPSVPAAAPDEGAIGSAAECEPEPEPSDRLPIGLTRTAEYPSLVAPWIHGEPHQAVDEVLQALLTGTSPKHWSHVYTGNAMPSSAAFFLPAIPPLAAVPSTALARVLVGVDAFAQHPCAVQWLVGDCQRMTADEASAERVGEAEALRLHRRLMLDEMVSRLQHRLKRLASGKMSGLLEFAESTTGVATSQRSPLALSVAFAVPAAAQAAMKDATLRGRRAGAAASTSL